MFSIWAPGFGIFLVNQYTCCAGLFKFLQILAVASACFLCFISWWKFSAIFKLLNLVSQLWSLCPQFLFHIKPSQLMSSKLTCYKISYCSSNSQCCLTMATVQANDESTEKVGFLSNQKIQAVNPCNFIWKNADFINNEVRICFNSS